MRGVQLLHNVLQVLIAEFEHLILDQSLLRVQSVEEVQQLNHIRLIFQAAEYFILARHFVPYLLGSFDGNHLVVDGVIGLEHVPYNFGSVSAGSQFKLIAVTTHICQKLTESAVADQFEIFVMGLLVSS